MANEKQMKYIHKIDKNSMYLASVTGLLVGEGDPEHVDGAAFDERLPGFWRIKAERGASPYDSSTLPSPARMDVFAELGKRFPPKSRGVPPGGIEITIKGTFYVSGRDGRRYRGVWC